MHILIVEKAVQHRCPYLVLKFFHCFTVPQTESEGVRILPGLPAVTAHFSKNLCSNFDQQPVMHPGSGSMLTLLHLILKGSAVFHRCNRTAECPEQCPGGGNGGEAGGDVLLFALFVQQVHAEFLYR